MLYLDRPERGRDGRLIEEERRRLPDDRYRRIEDDRRIIAEDHRRVELPLDRRDVRPLSYRDERDPYATPRRAADEAVAPVITPPAPKIAVAVDRSKDVTSKVDRGIPEDRLGVTAESHRPEIGPSKPGPHPSADPRGRPIPGQQPPPGRRPPPGSYQQRYQYY